MPKTTNKQIKHVAKLSNIPVTDEEAEELSKAFDETLDHITELQSVDVTGVEPTHQVTGFENVLREDEVRPETTFTQEEALANAKETHNGFFVVPRIIEEK